ncbi:MAG: hypothetical protein IJD63_03310 [Oscillospiraceae bacterium]|nr:hypothetical protein [Oscillospiraceae bacterium]
MDEFSCDYECRTVGEGITKYNIPDDWFAKFDVYDSFCPIISVRVDKIRTSPAMMGLKLRVIENPDDEYAGCMIIAKDKNIFFKIDYMIDLVIAMDTLLLD